MIHEAAATDSKRHRHERTFPSFGMYRNTVASPFVTIATIRHRRAPTRYGSTMKDPSRRTVLVDGGCERLLTDRETSAKMCLPLRGNGGGRLFATSIPRMSAPSLLPGPEREESIWTAWETDCSYPLGGEGRSHDGDFVFQVTEDSSAGERFHPVGGRCWSENVPMFSSQSPQSRPHGTFPGYGGRMAGGSYCRRSTRIADT